MSAKLGRDLWLSLRMRDLMNAPTEEQANKPKETRLWRLGFGPLKEVIGCYDDRRRREVCRWS